MPGQTDRPESTVRPKLAGNQSGDRCSTQTIGQLARLCKRPDATGRHSARRRNKRGDPKIWRCDEDNPRHNRPTRQAPRVIVSRCRRPMCRGQESVRAMRLELNRSLPAYSSLCYRLWRRCGVFRTVGFSGMYVVRRGSTVATIERSSAVAAASLPLGSGAVSAARCLSSPPSSTRRWRSPRLRLLCSMICLRLGRRGRHWSPPRRH